METIKIELDPFDNFDLDDQQQQQQHQHQQLNHHLQKTTSLKTCPLCTSQFVSMKELQHHKESVHLIPCVKGPVKCGFCSVTISDRYNLIKHIRHVHLGMKHKKKNKLKLNTFKCQYEGCSSIWQYPSDLKRHETRHLKPCDYNYKCTLCGKSFNRPHTLSRHIRIHTKEMPYSCPKDGCPARFVRRDVIHQHIWKVHPELVRKTSSGEVRLKVGPSKQGVPSSLKTQCQLCKRYITRNGLESHMRSHTNERPYKCDLCGYRAKDVQSLKVHSSTHERNKGRPSCPTCDKVFGHPTGVSNHIRRVHKKVVRVVCPICRKGCSNDNQLIIHWRRMHKIDLEPFVHLPFLVL